MFAIKKIRFRPLSSFELLCRLIFYGLLGVIGVSFLIFLFFLYRHFYLALSQAEEIVILQSQLAVDVLDIELYQKVRQAAAERQNIPFIKWDEISNPFKY